MIIPNYFVRITPQIDNQKLQQATKQMKGEVTKAGLSLAGLLRLPVTPLALIGGLVASVASLGSEADKTKEKLKSLFSMFDDLETNASVFGVESGDLYILQKAAENLGVQQDLFLDVLRRVQLAKEEGGALEGMFEGQNAVQTLQSFIKWLDKLLSEGKITEEQRVTSINEVVGKGRGGKIFDLLNYETLEASKSKVKNQILKDYNVTNEADLSKKINKMGALNKQLIGTQTAENIKTESMLSLQPGVPFSSLVKDITSQGNITRSEIGRFASSQDIQELKNELADIGKRITGAVITGANLHINEVKQQNTVLGAIRSALVPTTKIGLGSVIHDIFKGK